MHNNLLPFSSRFRPVLFLFMLVFASIVLPVHAQADGTLRFSLTITDFYDPLLPPEQNQILLNELTPEQITVAGSYEPIRDRSKTVIKRVYHRDCMVGVMCFGGKWVTEKTNDYIKALSVNYLPEERQIVFELPAPLNTPSLAYRLYAISITTPLVSINMLYEKNTATVPYVDDHILSKLYLTNPDPDDRYPHVVLASHKGVMAYLDTSSQTSKPPQGKTTFSDQERKMLFSERKLLDYGGLFPITIPKTLPAWYQINHSTRGFYQTRGIWVNDQEMEAVILKGYVAYTQKEKTREYYSKDEYWLRNKGQLTHIYLEPIHTPDYGCNFTYGITFFNDGTEERYIAKDLKNKEKFDERLMGKKKIHVTLTDLSALDTYESEREQYYANQEKRYPSIENGLPACKRMIADAKRLLGSPKVQLEQEFEQYRKIIKAADKERRKGF